MRWGGDAIPSALDEARSGVLRGGGGDAGGLSPHRALPPSGLGAAAATSTAERSGARLCGLGG